MTDRTDHSFDNAHRVFAGLTPSATTEAPTQRETHIINRSLLTTVPIMLAGSVAMTGMSAPIDAAEPHSTTAPARSAATSTIGTQLRAALATASEAIQPESVSTGNFATAALAPANYRVGPGDTVSGIASRFGLATASVLAMNGLGWKSVIYPGQVLTLGGTTSTAASAPTTAPAPASTAPTRYTIKRGDTISAIAKAHGLATRTLLSVNGLGPTSIIYPGQAITIPAGAASAAPAAAPAAAPRASAPTTAEPTTPVVNTPAPAAAYTIARGDTLSSIAARAGVTLDALLAANGLTRSSMIYAGRPLTIPGAPLPQNGSTVTSLTAEMRANARIIVDVGAALGVPEYGIVIALATAMQESSLRNIGYGDRDSLGLFQQRPSAGWGTPEQVLNATHAAKLFYGGPSNPNLGVTRGLLEIPGWQQMTLTRAAQAVQISAYPDAYAKWETSARAWYAELR